MVIKWSFPTTFTKNEVQSNFVQGLQVDNAPRTNDDSSISSFAHLPAALFSLGARPDMVLSSASVVQTV